VTKPARQTTDLAADSVTGRSPWSVFAVVASAIVLGTLNFGAVFVAFGEIGDDFGVDDTDLSWALTAFSITLAALMIPAGWMADRFGRRRIFLIGLSVFVVGSGLVALAPNLELLIAARIVQAAGLAFESPASLAIALDAFPDDMRATVVGAIGAMGGLSAAIAPVLSGLFIDVVGWRGTFGVAVPLGVVVMAVAVLWLPKDQPTQLGRGRPDLLGAAMISVGLGSLALGIVQSDDWGLTNARTIATLVMSVAAIGTVVVRSRSHPSPILELSLYKQRSFPVGNVLSILLAGNFAATFLTFVTFTRETWDQSLVASGLLLAYIPTIAGPLSFVAGRLADRYGSRHVIVPGALCMLFGALWVYVGIDEEANILGLWLPAVGLYAVGVGLAHASSTAVSMRDVPERFLGIGGGTNRIAMELGSTVAVAVVVVLAADTSGLDALRRVMVMLIAVSAVGAVLAATMLPRNPAPAAGG
jgi:EmrB/QacA subfamily drug resistance transporter